VRGSGAAGEREGIAAETLPVGGLTDEELARELEARGLGITVQEARRLRELLGGDPTAVEVALFDVMWSEHCSYKSSKRILRGLPTEGSNVVLGPGEDAGVVRLTEHGGRTYCVVMAHESHNHPSQVLPVEGAATGIGGIVRDVYCMGARVIGVMDALRFGDPDGPAGSRASEIARGVVTGVWQYGNALGVPNLGGDVYFARCFDENCLVNVVAIGIVAEDEIVRSAVPEEARREQYDLILIGKPTDRSGYKGASFASKILSDGGQGDKGAVQVPDPFLKRVLTEATAAVLKAAREEGVALGFKDLGAGGISCAFSEMASRGGFGARIDLGAVPLDGESLPPEVIACSETQERYAMAAPRRFTPRVLEIYNREYELPRLYPGAGATVVGDVTADGVFTAAHEGRTVCRSKVETITAGVLADRKAVAPAPAPPGPKPPAPDDLAGALLSVAASRNCSSREPVFSYYDWDVQGRTVIRPGEADASVVAPIQGCSVGVAVAVDGNPLYGALDPYWAGACAVAEAMRNVAAVGAAPIALTDCLNYGNPEKPEVFHQFAEGVRGIADAARRIWRKGTNGEPVPVISGNVSFYNEAGSGQAVNPTPVVACVGAMDDFSKAVTMHAKRAGNRLLLVGERRGALGGSAYLAAEADAGARYRAQAPHVDFDAERAAIHGTIDCIQEGLVRSCHDISDGGLAMCILEMLMVPGGAPLGADVDLDALGSSLEAHEILFGEDGGFVLEAAPESRRAVLDLLGSCGAKAWDVGRTTDDGVLRCRAGGRLVLELDVARALVSWREGLKSIWPL